MQVRELAAFLGVEFEGDGAVEILRAAPLESAGSDEIAFVGNAKAARQASASKAGCLIVPLEFRNERTVLRAADPRGAFARALARLHPPAPIESGIHPTAIIHPTAKICQNVSIGAYSTVGANVEIGDGVRLFDNVTVYHDVRIGARTVIHSGAVIGADGFGFAFTGDCYEKFPQVGRVEIGADVEIGANSCVDRATLGVTMIGDGTKLDNMVHVGHNVAIGKHVVIAAQTGVSGGAEIGDYAVLGGQVGVADKVKIEAKSIVGAQAGIPSSKIIHAGEPVWGTPARPIKEYLKQLAQLSYIEDLRKEVAELKRRLDEK